MLALAWPMILTNLGQTAMQATDVMMMGRLGPEALAAGTLGASLYVAPMIFGLGLMLATSPMMASELGRNRHSVRDVRRTVRQGMWLALVAAVPIWTLLWNADALFALMGQDPQLRELAASYVHAAQWAVLPFYWYIVLRSFTAALERPGWAMVIVFAAVGVNAFANWCLMFGNLGFPPLGVVGAGVATTVSSFAMFAGMSMVVILHGRFRRYSIFGRFWRPDWPRFVELLRLGLPIAAILLFEVSIFAAAAFLMGLIDAISLAAHAIAIQICSISFMVPMGISQAATVRVGRAYGARNPDAVTVSGWTAFVLGVGFMAVMGLLMLLVPRFFIGAFLDLRDPANQTVIATAASFLAIAALFQVVDGAQSVASGMLRGLHDTTVPMVIGGFGYWGVGLPVGIALAFVAHLEGIGIWIGLSCGLAVVAVALVARWTRRGRIRPAAEPPARRR